MKDSSHSLLGVQHRWEVSSPSKRTLNLLPFSPRLLPCPFSFLKALQLLHSGCWEAFLKQGHLQGLVCMSTVLCLRKAGAAEGTTLMTAGKLHVLLPSRRLTMKCNKAKRAACTCTICCYLVYFSKCHFFILVFLACNFSAE